jgi:signal transduction histidine kinase
MLRPDLRLDLFCFTPDSFPGRMASRRSGWDPSPHALLLEKAAVVGQQERESVDALAHRRLREVATITLPDAATVSMLDGLAGLHSFVLVIDSRLRVVWLNDQLGLVLGGAAKAVGRPASSLLDDLWPDDVAAFGDRVKQFTDEMIAKDRVAGTRFDLRLDGRALPLEVAAFRAEDSTGTDLVVCVADSHPTRESLEQKNEELETCVRSVSHDLRSPLVSLLGFSRLLRDDYREVLDETGNHFLDRIERAGRHMEQLLHDMLELSRIEATPHSRVHVNPTPILQQLFSELKKQLDEKNIELHLPEDPPTVLFDRTRLYQLLSNLIGNAVAHMGEGPTRRIDVEIETLSDGWQISVGDTGPGIATEDHDRIFEAFQTAGSPDGSEKKSGLGLAIVKKIVEAHSGRVWVESEPDAGARFCVWLPLG